MFNYEDFRDQRWIDKCSELLGRVDYQCDEEGCDTKATQVHICYYHVNRKIWDYPEDAYKKYCFQHREMRRGVENDMKEALAVYAIDELDRIHLVMKDIAVAPPGRRAQMLEQLYADAKRKIPQVAPMADYEDNEDNEDY